MCTRPRLLPSSWRFSLILQILFPFMLAGSVSVKSQSVVARNDLWRYRKGLSAPQADWKTADEAALDATWLSGHGGFGYADNPTETSLCQTLLPDMKGSYSTVVMRKTIQIATSPDPALHLLLTSDFDDGFAAWLDGVYLTSANSPNTPNEPAFGATAIASRESSRGDNSAVSPTTYDLGAVGTRLAPGNHVLAILGLNSSKASSSDFIQIHELALAPAPSTNCESGSILANTVWYLTNSPITVCGGVTVQAGATLTIEPGVVVQLAQGVDLIVANGGRLLAEGNETNRIHFTKAPNAAAWGGIEIDGSVGSPESRITYTDIDSNGTTAIHSNGGTLFADHVNFGARDHQYISLDRSSFVVSHCFFPPPSTKFEPGHGTGGIKGGGHGIFDRNYFGGTVGYSDVVDFTGGNRPEPIVHFINNVIESGQDDGWDLDGTDAWVEGNIFLHVHRNGDTPDSSSAISGGNDGGNTSDVSIVGNLFFDCDNAVTAKQGNFFALVNNTIVHMTKTGGIDGDSGALTVRDTTPSPTMFARGMYAEANIILDVSQLVRNYVSGQTTVTLANNIVSQPWNGPGESNVVEDPLLSHIPSVREASFDSWQAAQVVRDWFSLRTNSPALGRGPDGRDIGGVVPLGVAVSGAPSGSTTNRSAFLHVGFFRSGYGMPATGWPEGMGYTHYKWNLDGGSWSAETPITTPITLNALPDGRHFVEVVGKRDSGLYQNDPLFGDDAVITRTPAWMVSSVASVAITAIERVGNEVTIAFDGVQGQTYSLLASDRLDSEHSWTKVEDIPERSSSGLAILHEPINNTQRFFQLVRPARP